MEIKTVKKNNETIVKKGNKILGYVSKVKNGYGYAFGKPSDYSSLVFSKDVKGNEKGYTEDEALDKLTKQLEITFKLLPLDLKI